MKKKLLVFVTLLCMLLSLSVSTTSYAVSNSRHTNLDNVPTYEVENSKFVIGLFRTGIAELIEFKEGGEELDTMYYPFVDICIKNDTYDAERLNYQSNIKFYYNGNLVYDDFKGFPNTGGGAEVGTISGEDSILLFEQSDVQLRVYGNIPEVLPNDNITVQFGNNDPIPVDTSGVKLKFYVDPSGLKWNKIPWFYK